jgi:hypothetical protein
MFDAPPLYETAWTARARKRRKLLLGAQAVRPYKTCYSVERRFNVRSNSQG